MIPEITEIESKLKEILYCCLEQIRATKAALYLTTENQPYELVTQYGFKEGLRKLIPANDPTVDLLFLKRVPFFVNTIGEDARFAETLDSAATSKMLVTPIYSKGRLYGLVDMRDKAGGRDFDFNDSDSAQKISQQFLELFAEKGVFGLRKENVTPVTFSGTQLVTAPEPPAPPVKLTSRVIDEAQKFIERGGLRAKATARVLSEQQVIDCSVVLPGVLSIPGVVLASLSTFSEFGGHQVIAASAAVSGEAMEHFQAKLKAWQQKRNEPDKLTSTTTQYPFGRLGMQLGQERLVSTLSAPVRVPGVPGVVLTASFDGQPSPEMKTQLEDFLTRLEKIAKHALATDELASLRQRVAQKLIEPDLSHFAHLKNHSERVSDLAERLALFAGLEPAEVEKVRLAAYVHDVGMRLLDYQNLYRKVGPSSDDMAIMKSHSIVGAAVVADSPLGPEIANIVLNHHERPDGTGYPGGLSIDAVPIGSRIIHICESFDAMTAPDTYQVAVPPQAALTKIRRAAGIQFDSVLAEKFIEVMSRE